MNTDMTRYYRERAKEYDEVYKRPYDQHDLQHSADILEHAFAGKNILEICCGTGYWTERLAKTATAIHATDINDAVIEMAMNRFYGTTPVTFETADFYAYTDTKLYDGLFGGFIWSHIQLEDLHKFLLKANSFVLPGGTVAFMDSIYVEGKNHPISHTDENGNTYQTRKLADGSTHLVRKNFPTEAFIKEQLKDIGENVQVISLQYYWIVLYTKVSDT